MRSLFLLSILLTIPQTPVKLAQSPKTILDGAASDIRKTAQAWYFASGVICSFPPLLDEQESQYCGDWYTAGSDPKLTTPAVLGSVTVYQITNAEVVSRWMKSEATRLSPGSVVVPYDLGVPAYLSTLESPPTVGITFFGVGITFGKGRFIVLVNGTSKADVNLVARSVLRQISN